MKEAEERKGEEEVGEGEGQRSDRATFGQEEIRTAFTCTKET